MDCGDLSRWVINKMEFVIAMGINYSAVAPGVSSPRLDMIVILNGGNESISSQCPHTLIKIGRKTKRRKEVKGKVKWNVGINHEK